MKKFCELNIQVEVNNAQAVISGLKENIRFDPTVILSELRYAKEPQSPELLFSTDFDDFDYDYEYAFGNKIKIKNTEREQYYKLVSTIKRLLKISYESKQPFDFQKIEFLRDFYDISFTYTPSYQRDFYLNKITSQAPKHVELSAKYYHFSEEEAIKLDIASIHNYFFECFSVADLVFAILYFLAINQYKITKCKHCKRYFATKTYKQEYCHRKAIYPRYSHLNCEQAIRSISQEFKRGYNRIYLKLNPTNNTMYNSECEIFKEKYCDFKKEFSLNPDYENIKKGFMLIEEWEQRVKKE